MFSVREGTGAPSELELVDEVSDAVARVAPSRGAIVTGLRFGGRELLYMDAATLRDPEANVRGGIPLLFPNPGKLTDDRWAWRGARGRLPQHGFARRGAWTVRATDTSTAAQVVLGLAWSDPTGEHFPWEVDLTLTLTLARGGLRVALGATNQGATPMPFAAGFHPYFSVNEEAKARARVPTAASRAFDNRRKETGPLGPLDFTAAELDVHLLDHGDDHARLELDDGSVIVGGSPELRTWVLWTVRDKPFVCVEPWSAPGNALNTDESVRAVAPGDSARVEMSLAWEPR